MRFAALARTRLARTTRHARTLRVPSADKPAWPCLAARIPYGRLSTSLSR